MQRESRAAASILWVCVMALWCLPGCGSGTSSKSDAGQGGASAGGSGGRIGGSGGSAATGGTSGSGSAGGGSATGGNPGSGGAGGSGGLTGSGGRTGSGGAAGSGGTTGSGGAGAGGGSGGVAGAGGAGGGSGSGGTGGAGGAASCSSAPPVPCPSTQVCDRDTPNRCAAGFDPGHCIALPTICPTVVMPVCGCNNQTYNNECERQRARIQLAHTGMCI